MEDYTGRLNDIFIRQRFNKTDFLKIIDLDTESPCEFLTPRSQILCVDTIWNYDTNNKVADVYSARIRIELSNGKPYYLFTDGLKELGHEEFLNAMEDTLQYIVGGIQLHGNNVGELYVTSEPNFRESDRVTFVVGSGKEVTW